MRGGTAFRREPGDLDSGLSPRARGNLESRSRTVNLHGSIPACAGEPAQPAKGRPQRRVYPRVRGGTCVASDAARVASGLSPRARGNPRTSVACAQGCRSIPACAGEPEPVRPRIGDGSVYPRVRGGTSVSCSCSVSSRGLSPRARGNLRRAGGRMCRTGSIPACAGEPTKRFRTTMSLPVYPRVRGGTVASVGADRAKQGLSPRARGNHARVPGDRFEQGSIPACAGEPTQRIGTGKRIGVYPRVRGGTPARAERGATRAGLSPRARGNREVSAVLGIGRGSIPACAGEPAGPWPAVCGLRVYPRVRGGTQPPYSDGELATGLSPRARGNR